VQISAAEAIFEYNEQVNCKLNWNGYVLQTYCFCFYVALFGLGSPWKADLAISADVSLFVQSYNGFRSRNVQNNHSRVSDLFNYNYNKYKMAFNTQN